MTQRKLQQQQAASTTKRSSNYRSKFEASVAKNLDDNKIKFSYETINIDYIISSSYCPDIIFDNGIICEIKGLFRKEERRKHLAIQAQHPTLDIRFVFQNSKTKLSKAKGSLTYAKWCERHGFLYADKIIPPEWYDNPGKNTASRKKN
jgi:hypothetical protein